MAGQVGTVNPQLNTAGITGQSAWGQLDQLLTCAICLDRFRNPKLLPCQHTFCMDPCLEGLIDYIRRQIKCPECRAEHRIPYQGIQGYPTNVTLMRFLELHFEVTGETPDLTPTVKERCGVCSEKAYLTQCGHCDKKVCPDCKDAHVDILKREISRINNQVRRGLHRLQDALGQADKSVGQLQLNCANVTQEAEDIFRRLHKALNDREETIKNEVQALLQSELRNLTQLKENLEIEVNNIQSNCDLTEKHVNDSEEWEDVELVDYKETFLKTLEFVRNFDPDQAEFNARLKLHTGTEPELLLQNIAHLGDLTVNCPHIPTTNTPANNQNLMRSKSDHRLATQMHRQEEQQRGYLGVGHRYGSGHSSDTESRQDNNTGGYRRPEDGERFGRGRYGRDVDGSWRREDDVTSSSYRSRFGRDDALREGSDPEAVSGRSVRFARTEQTDAPPPRERLFDIEDTVRGPMSGIARFLDSPVVVRRIQQNEQRAQKKLDDKKNPPAPAPAPTPVPVPQPVQPTTQTTPARKTQRQLSEDEIDRIKAQNKGSTTTTTTTTAVATTTTTTTTTTDVRPVVKRVNALQKTEEPSESGPQQQQQPKRKTGSRHDDANTDAASKATARQTSRDTESSHPGPSRQTSRDADFKTPPSTPRKLSVDSTKSDATESEGSVAARKRFFTRQSSDGSKVTTSKTPSISESSKSQSQSSNSSGSDTDTDKANSAATPVVAPTVNEVRGLEYPNYNRFRKALDSHSQDTQDDPVTKGRLKSSTPARRAVDAASNASSSTDGSPARSAISTKSEEDAPRARTSSFRSTKPEVRSPSVRESVEKPKFVSRFLPRQPTTESNKSSSESDSDSDDEEAKEAARDASIHALLARSALARRESATGSGTGAGTGTGTGTRSLYGNRANDDTLARKSTSSSYLRDKDTDTVADRYSSLASRYSQSRRSSSNLADDDKDDNTSSRYGSSYASRYLSRSKSSAAVGSERDPSPEVERSGRSTGSSTSAGADRYRKESRFSALRRNRIGRSRSSHDIASRDDDDDDDQVAPAPSSVYTPASTYRSPRFDPLPEIARSRSHHALLRDLSPDDGTSASAISSWAKYLKNKYGGRTGARDETRESPRESVVVANLPRNPYGRSFERGADKESDDSGDENKNFDLNTTTFENPRTAYLQKRRIIMTIGKRGSEPGNFTWPRDVAVGPDNCVVIGDSSNHRVQLFDSCGRFLKEFGSYGNAEGEFDCLAGVTVNRIGQFIISDRYNHRIQVFDPSGRFLRSFGSQGSTDGRLSYPWGIGTDSLGFIYVCDKENHRVQVFQSDGTFVGKFGSLGDKVGQLEHPHYIAMSNTNKVYISDGNNHRIQVFDVNGRIITSFGSEGTEEGQFKYPRGVAVDDQGYVIVGDSGNNRIQIFTSEGVFLRAFGSWGSGDGEFKGLEGVAATLMASKALVLRCRSGTPLLYALIIIVTRRAKQRLRSGSCRLVAFAYAYNEQRPLTCILV
uniref:RING-type domain-containing protein n=1 Tax=Strigamia maritima TaxID=126957 RepID=T1JAZ0_STRMM